MLQQVALIARQVLEEGGEGGPEVLPVVVQAEAAALLKAEQPLEDAQAEVEEVRLEGAVQVAEDELDHQVEDGVGEGAAALRPTAGHLSVAHWLKRKKEGVN